MNSRRRRQRRERLHGEWPDLPTFARLAVRFDGDPCETGPPSGEWVPWDIDYSQYEMDLRDPKWYRTLSMMEMHADIPTGAWPAIGDPHGTSGEHQLAPPEGGPPL